MKTSFAINQATTPNLPFVEFVALARSLGCVGIEARNDLGRPLFDGLEPEDAGARIRDAGLRLHSINQVFPFHVGEQAKLEAIRQLADVARRAGAEAISLIPSLEGPAFDEPRASFQRILIGVVPILEHADVVGLVEPLGLSTASLRSSEDLAAAFESLGNPRHLRMVHDTFQCTLRGGWPLHPGLTALVQISGVDDAGATFDDDLDGHRGLVGPNDRAGALEQMRRFVEANPNVPFSFECTEPSLHALEDPSPALAASMAYLEASLSR